MNTLFMYKADIMDNSGIKKKKKERVEELQSIFCTEALKPDKKAA